MSIEETESSRKLENLARRTRVRGEDGVVVKLSLADVRRGLQAAYGTLVEVAERARVEAMRAELAAIEAEQASPAFWDRAFGSAGKLSERHRLSVEVRRFDDLRGRVDLLRELVEASFVEAEDAAAHDLARDFVRLERDLARARRELVSFGEADKGDASVAIRVASGKDGGDAWAARLAAMYAAWAAARGYDVEAAAPSGGRHVVLVQGPYALGYLRGERGGHRIIAPPKGKGDKKGETFLLHVDVGPYETSGAVP
jgi:peptide chain release factor 2